jgi:uncharacterized phage-associated protein
MTTAIQAAEYLLTLDERSEGDLTSNLKLQKLLYYAQGVHLALHKKPLFGEKIEAWQHGPVCPPVYRKYKEFTSKPIPVPTGFAPSALSKRDRDTLDEIHTVYGQFSAWRLREMTHSEPPWKNNYREGSRNVEIPHSEMRDYFLTQLR